jgi:hypothetical protein
VLYEQTFVSSQLLYGKFRTALEAGEYLEASAAARAMQGMLGFIDAAALTLLAARQPGKWTPYKEMSARWVARLVQEHGLDLDGMTFAAETFTAAENGDDDEAFVKLVNLYSETAAKDAQARSRREPT